MDLNTWSSVTDAVWEADKTLGCRIFVEEVCHWSGPLLPSCSLSALCVDKINMLPVPAVMPTVGLTSLTLQTLPSET